MTTTEDIISDLHLQQLIEIAAERSGMAWEHVRKAALELKRRREDERQMEAR